jgi:hypothetical protein
MDVTYIYYLKDPITDEIRYVGKTNNLKRRLNYHIKRSSKYNFHSAAWINSLIEKGEFPIMVELEKVYDDSWKDREKYWINYYREKYDLTNVLDGGQDGPNKETILKMKESIRRHYDSTLKKINQYDLNGNFIKKWRSSVEASNELKINNSNINLVCKGIRNKAGGFMWRYDDDCEDNIGEYLKKPNYNEKKILQSTLDDEIIKTYNNTKQASIETKILRTSIVNCLQNRTKTAGGYKWKYI